MAIELLLADYGIFGLWTVTNIGMIGWFMKQQKDDKAREQLQQERLINALEQNAISNTTLAEKIENLMRK